MPFSSLREVFRGKAGDRPLADISSRQSAGESESRGALTSLLDGFSIEITPRVAAKNTDIGGLLRSGTRVYITHIDGTDIGDMVATAYRLNEQGLQAVPHIPARSIPDRPTFSAWLQRYREDANVTQALVIAGGRARPEGEFSSAIDLLRTGLFDEYGYSGLEFAGHPEGNRDIDRDGSTNLVDQALLWKQEFASRTDADVGLVTQFVFDEEPLISWAKRVKTLGVTLPIRVGVAGPAKLHTLIKYALACGVGPSANILRKRTGDMAKLLATYEPDGLLKRLAGHCDSHPDCLIKRVHFYSFGGVANTAEWARGQMAD